MKPKNFDSIYDKENTESEKCFCGDCYYYSDITVKMCDYEHEPVTAEEPACEMFDRK